MAVAFSDVKSICQEAFYILRQDATVLTEANWNAETPIEVAKCKLAVETAANEVADAFQWRSAMTIANIGTWPAKMRNACVYCLARELALPIAGRLEDMKTYDALYRDKILQAKLTDLNKTLSYNSDPVLAQLVSNFKADDPSLVTAYSVYSQRITSVRDTSKFELKAALGVEEISLDQMHLLDALVVAKLASVCGLDANVAQIRSQEYAAKLAEYRKVKLNEKLAENDDPVLAQLLANFRTDDTGLLNAYEIYTKRADAVKADSEATVRDMIGLVAGTALTGSAKDAAIALSVSKLAGACGLDANYANLKMQEYQAIITEAKRKSLESIAKNTSATTGLMHDAIEEVKLTLGIDGDPDALALAAAEALCYARNGEGYAYDANFVQLKEQEYAAKVQEYRRVMLNRQLAGNTDPVLAQLLANFRADDAGLINAYEIYTQRSTVAKGTATTEINAAHKWRTPFSPTDTTHSAYPAWVVLSCAKLASVCGFAADRVQLFMAEYDKLLSTARAADLEEAKKEITDADTKQVLSMISTNFVSGDVLMPRSIEAITNRIDTLKDTARKEVLLAQDWNFAKVVEVQDYEAQQNVEPNPDEMPYVFAVDYPTSALRLIAVFGFYGKLAEWKIEDGKIKSREPIVKVKYTTDVTDFTKWSAFAKNAYIHRLAADVARTVMNNQQDAAQQEALYNLAIENAKLRDTRESSTPTDAWGDNFYVGQMQGRRRGDEIAYRPDPIWR